MTQIQDTDGYGPATYYDYNAFLTNCDRTVPNGTHDQIVTNFNWQSRFGWNFYLPTNSALINAGAFSATNIGLYHFTVTTNQVPETNSIVDIGYHRVALDTSGNPRDADSDGVPNYVEDSTGDGVYNTGDLSNWNSADTDGDGVNDLIELLQGRNPRNAATASDTNSVIKLQVYTPLR
jgi:hypothetical protein